MQITGNTIEEIAASIPGGKLSKYYSEEELDDIVMRANNRRKNSMNNTKLSEATVNNNAASSSASNNSSSPKLKDILYFSELKDQMDRVNKMGEMFDMLFDKAMKLAKKTDEEKVSNNEGISNKEEKNTMAELLKVYKAMISGTKACVLNIRQMVATLIDGLSIKIIPRGKIEYREKTLEEHLEEMERMITV